MGRVVPCVWRYKMNVVALCGHLSSQPVIRELQSGSVVMGLELTTRVEEAGISVPLAWFDPPADLELAAGDEIMALGTVRRCFFRAGGATQSRTEVVVSLLARSDDKRAVAKIRKRLGVLMGAERADGLRSS